MTKILLLLVALVATVTSSADVRTDKQMKDIAIKALTEQAGSKMRKAKANVNNLREVYSCPELKIYDIEQVGGVIVTCDDDFEPVLATLEESFTSTYMPANFRWWLETTCNTIRQRKIMGLGDIEVELGATQPSNVSNFLRTKWAQSSPFNDACPLVGGQRTLVGCTATAMAQIFKYFQYPAKANGAGGYTYSVQNSKGEMETVSRVLWSTKNIDWSNMINNYSGTYTDTQATAVANLMRDCGYSVQMQYGLDASASSPMYVAQAVAKTFRYDSLQVGNHYRVFYTDAEWNDMIYSELAKKNPVFYGGATNAGEGHAFVLCGMQENGKVYCNWGWEGQFEGYFSLKYLTCEGLNFAERSNVIVLGFRPEASSEGETRGRYATSLWCLSEPKITVTDDGGLTFETPGFFNYNGSLCFQGYLYFLLENKEDSEYDTGLFITDEEDVFRPYEGGSISGLDLLHYITDIVPGSYRLTLRAHALNDRDDVECCARVEGGIMMYDVEIGANGRAVTATRVDPVKAVQIVEEVGIDDIPETIRRPDLNAYNLCGRRVNDNYRGIVIRNGKKFLKK